MEQKEAWIDLNSPSQYLAGQSKVEEEEKKKEKEKEKRSVLRINEEG
jgi:hypothetical protein